MSTLIDLSDTVVAVTGGTRGVGRGIVAQFIRAGAHVETCARREPESVPSVDGVEPHLEQLDIRDPDALDAWMGGIAERHGRLDVLVNNAGGSPFGRFEDGSARYMRALTELNFLSAAFAARAAYPLLRGSEGTVINISSISARRPSPGTAVYGAAKAALESLTRSLAAEWAPQVRVNAVSCGLVATEGAVEHYGTAEDYARVARTIPRGRLATPEEIGDVCVFLSSPLSTHVTGAVVPVDGGGEWPAFLAHTPNAHVFPGDARNQGATS